jgi:hypothetical protein
MYLCIWCCSLAVRTVSTWCYVPSLRGDAGLQEFARYYGFYAGADKAGQGAMAFGSNATNLQQFKDRFRWACMQQHGQRLLTVYRTDAQPRYTRVAYVQPYMCSACASI